MAVSVQAPFHSKSGMWNLGDPPTSFSSTRPDGIPVSMPYQYPLPLSSLESSSSILPSFHHPHLDHPQQSSTSQVTAASPNLKHQAGSKSAKIKKSMSTPNVRGQASADAALALSAEKRRNKLGYHRTSVACGHCRRRKIRCIPAPADPQNRCSNCIRLKKECNFYPVDQQPPPDPRRRDSKAQSGNDRASESSSPSTTSGQLPEIPSALPYAHLNMPPIQDLGGPQMKRPRTESFSPEDKGPTLPMKPYPESYHPTVVTSSRNYEYPQVSQGATNWMAPDASPSSKAPGEGPPSFWRGNPHDSPMTPAFSPFTPNLTMPPAQSWPISHPEASPREDLSWAGSAPQRSISYSNLEGLQNQTHQQYSPYPHAPTQPAPEHYTTKPRILPSSGMYPPPIATSGNHVAPSEPGSAPGHDISHQQPHSANSLPPVPFNNWQQQPYYQKPASAGAEHYGGGWNTPQQGQPHLHGQPGPPGPGYYGDHAGGAYYPPPHR